MNDKKQLFLFAAIGCCLVFTFLSMNMPSPTGAAVTKAYTLGDVIRDFLGADRVELPMQGCGILARELYDNIALIPLDEISGFATQGADRSASYVFSMDRVRLLGNLGIIKSTTIPMRKDSNVLINFDVEAVAAEPKDLRSNFFAAVLYGRLEDRAVVVRQGAVETPTLECSFEVDNGDIDCYCETRKVAGIARGKIPPELSSQGLPGAVTITERSGQRWE